MKRLSLDRIVPKRADLNNDYLQIKPESPDNKPTLKTNQPSIKNSPNKKGKWQY